MKAGYNIGIDWKRRRVMVGSEYEMMEEFMGRVGIENSQDVYTLQGVNKARELQQRVASYLRCGGPGKTLLQVIWNIQEGGPAPFPGGDKPSVSMMARNTSLFEPRGPAMGDF